MDIIKKIVTDYKKNATDRIMMVDTLIVFSVASVLLQVSKLQKTFMAKCHAYLQMLYGFLVGTFPFNSYLSGVFCHISLCCLGGNCNVDA